jgi:Protein of unknown function (DUF1559)/Domain of unknown function (DUF4190)
MIQFRCECGQQLQAQDAHAGKRTRCPNCGLDQVVPASAAIQPARGPAADPPSPLPDARATPGPRRQPRRRFDDGDEYDEDYDRPRRPAPTGTSGKAVVSLVLGVLSPCASVLTGIPAIILGLLSLRDIRRSGGRLGGQGLAIAGIVVGIVGILLSLPVVLLVPAVQKVRESATRIQSANSLKMIGIGMHSYHANNGRFPPAVVYDGQGKPLYSWRVLLLPYVEEDQLYNQFHLDEPWDSPHNRQLLARMPKVYAPPGGVATKEPYSTFYQVFDGPGSVFDSDTKRFPLVPFPAGPRPDTTFASGKTSRMTTVTDGTSNTFLVVEAGEAVPWSKPADLSCDPTQPLPKLGGLFNGDFNVLYADGAVKFVRKGADEKAIRAGITESGGEMLFLP